MTGAEGEGEVGRGGGGEGSEKKSTRRVVLSQRLTYVHGKYDWMVVKKKKKKKSLHSVPLANTFHK